MNVAISEGVRLSDDNARRFAQHMLGDLRRYNDRAATAMNTAMTRHGGSFGNPKGLQRLFGRVIKAMGPTYFQGSLYGGKKGNFRFDHTTFIADKDEGLFLSTVTIEGRGKIDPPEIRLTDLLSFSSHALQRLIQRAGIRQGDDYIPLLRALALPALMMSACISFEKDRGIPGGAAWPLPVRVNGRRVLLLVKCDPHCPPTAVTVYKENWRNFPAVARLEEMLAAFMTSGEKWGGSVEEEVRPFREAFKAAAKHFERSDHA